MFVVMFFFYDTFSKECFLYKSPEKNPNTHNQQSVNQPTKKPQQNPNCGYVAALENRKKMIFLVKILVLTFCIIFTSWSMVS